MEELVPSVPVKQVIDTTGCGDSFAGGLSYGLLQKPKDYIEATQYGNVLGAMRTQGKTFDVFKSLAETKKNYKKNVFLMMEPKFQVLNSYAGMGVFESAFATRC